jgi:hypothetical protein
VISSGLVLIRWVFINNVTLLRPALTSNGHSLCVAMLDCLIMIGGKIVGVLQQNNISHDEEPSSGL